MTPLDEWNLPKDYYRQQVEKQLYRRSGFDRRSGNERRLGNMMNYFLRLFSDTRLRKERRQGRERRADYQPVSTWSRLSSFFDS